MNLVEDGIFVEVVKDFAGSCKDCSFSWKVSEKFFEIHIRTSKFLSTTLKVPVMILDDLLWLSLEGRFCCLPCRILHRFMKDFCRIFEVSI